MSAKLTDNNANIADLSDGNRATKLGERYSSLYCDEYTNAFEYITESMKLSDEDNIKLLINLLIVSSILLYEQMTRNIVVCLSIHLCQSGMYMNEPVYPCYCVCSALQSWTYFLNVTQYYNHCLYPGISGNKQ